MLLADALNELPPGWEVDEFHGVEGLVVISKGRYTFRFEHGMWRYQLDKTTLVGKTPSDLISQIKYLLTDMMQELKDDY